MMPQSYVRLTAGRNSMSDGNAGALLFRGRKFDLYLTTARTLDQRQSGRTATRSLMGRLGLTPDALSGHV